MHGPPLESYFPFKQFFITHFNEKYGLDSTLNYFVIVIKSLSHQSDLNHWLRVQSVFRIKPIQLKKNVFLMFREHPGHVS